jgi:hypothetical protein
MKGLEMCIGPNQQVCRCANYSPNNMNAMAPCKTVEIEVRTRMNSCFVRKRLKTW